MTPNTAVGVGAAAMATGKRCGITDGIGWFLPGCAATSHRGDLALSSNLARPSIDREVDRLLGILHALCLSPRRSGV